VVGPARSAALHLRTAQRVARRRGGGIRARLGPLDERMVFVLGSPRSGTTFLTASIGSLSGFADLGEVAAFKAAIPALAAVPPEEAAPSIRRLLGITRRLGLVGSARAVEGTPETAFVATAVALAFPQAKLVHIVRDGRDVVCSLLERGWLSAGRRGEDDAWLPYGAKPRFWVEPERSSEFAAGSDVRRAAWAWRRYVAAARRAESVPASGGPRYLEVRYERLTDDPAAVADDLSRFLGAPHKPLADALDAAHGFSVGRYERELTDAQLAEVLDESGDLLHELGYVPAR
jgi:hypothetical protein